MVITKYPFDIHHGKTVYGQRSDFVNFYYWDHSKERITKIDSKSLTLDKDKIVHYLHCYAAFCNDDNFGSSIEVLCLPGPNHILPFKYTKKVFDIFRAEGLIPKNIYVLRVKGKARLHIKPFVKYNKKQLYVALCLYRWCDFLPELVYDLVYLYKCNKKIDFWQILCYILSQHVVNTGHSFVPGMSHKNSISFVNSLNYKMIYHKINCKSKQCCFINQNNMPNQYFKGSDILNEELKKYYEIRCNS